jgi:hypothetical protein
MHPKSKSFQWQHRIGRSQGHQHERQNRILDARTTHCRTKQRRNEIGPAAKHKLQILRGTHGARDSARGPKNEEQEKWVLLYSQARVTTGSDLRPQPTSGKLSRLEKTANNKRTGQLKEKNKFLPRELFLGSTELVGGKLVLTGAHWADGKMDRS